MLQLKRKKNLMDHHADAVGAAVRGQCLSKPQQQLKLRLSSSRY